MVTSSARSKVHSPRWAAISRFDRKLPFGRSSAIARAYVKAAPERLVWGSDWPHPGVRDPEPKPDDAILIDLMLDWAPDEAVRNRIFVDNAAKLYDFPKS
jgi:D-galactarolactone isomerase